MSQVALAATLHDPGCADLAATIAAVGDLAQLYAGIVISATAETPERALAPLVAAGALVTTHPPSTSATSTACCTGGTSGAMS
jgi:hypothetical protein